MSKPETMPVSRRVFLKSSAAAPLATSLAGAEAPSYAKHFREDHDVDLPAWGPYSNRYIGISHVADARRGLRFDLSVFPGYYRRKVTIPHGLWESDFHPWESSADLNYYAYRHQLEWKDRVYCDASYTRISDQSRLIRCECVNSTGRHQNLVLNYIGYLMYPHKRHEVVLPAGGLWLAALDYRNLQFATPRPQDNLTYDGLLRGEALDEGFTGRSGVGKAFGKERGDRIEYAFDLPAAIADAALLVRYRMRSGGTLGVMLQPVLAGRVKIEGTGAFQTQILPCGALAAGRHEFQFVSEGGEALDLDGFVVAPRSSIAGAIFRAEEQNVHPEAIAPGPRPNSLLLKYKTVDAWYGIAWNHPRSQVRQYLCGELDNFFRFRTQDHVSLVQKGPGDGHFTNVFLRPIPIRPKSGATLHGMVCDGTRADVERMLLAFPTGAGDCEALVEAGRKGRVVVSGRAEGRRYEFSQQRLAMCSLANVHYPVYLRRHYIKHTTPGHFWDMLYSWDAGFTALGLLELDLDRALGLMNTYLTRPGDEHAAFIHHGTPLPVQIYLFHEIWNRTGSRELLAHYYPRLRQYHQFLAGRLGSSSTRRLKSQLLQTWDYFYNTGWDDYPPQMYMHSRKLEKSMAPPVTTAHAIRTAKILLMMAKELGEETDVGIYRQDIAVWTDSLQKHSWDEESGYYGYVEHDEAGNPKGILRHEGGQNFNMGTCGVYPFFAGICSRAQEKRLIGHMMSEQHLWTRIGMTTVDQSAAYYKPDGYWNGAVWFPHQWFIWKAMLDLGYGEEAERIARTGLDLWQQEVDDSYGCFEHFMVESGRGGGWHHFTSLSAPVLSWYSSYFRPGILTTGFDARVVTSRFDDDHRKLDARLELHGEAGRESIVLCGMRDSEGYQATVDGSQAPIRRLKSGTLEVRVRNGPGIRNLLVF
ncbi:MAG: trehalase family glycosidase [Acidobacteria bacterium]|nr:trehalase family glycosidase [Acidobacteriota bacterium]